MIKPLSLSLACGAYDRVRPLLDGQVPLDGLAIHHVPLTVPEMFFRTARYQEFDVAEFSLSSYLTSLQSEEPPFIAIPVFLSRAFRHGSVYVSAASGIERPKDLEGKRVGVTEYGTTASVWIRGMLADEYDVDPTRISWFSLREEKLSAGRQGITLHSLPNEKLDALLERGAIDATLGSFKVAGKGVRRLFPNYRELEIDYYRRTRIFPIMHLLAIKRTVYEEHPWVARTLYKAFSQARELCLQEFEQTSVPAVMMPWINYYLDEQRELLGADVWTYGIEANRVVLETFARYMHRQGLISRLVGVEEMFAPYRYTNVQE